LVTAMQILARDGNCLSWAWCWPWKIFMSLALSKKVSVLALAS